MTLAVDQAQAILAVLVDGTRATASIPAPKQALDLADEMVAIGEFRLALDLCLALESGDLSPEEKTESLFIRLLMLFST